MTVVSVFIRPLRQDGYHVGETYVQSEEPINIYAVEVSSDGKIIRAQMFLSELYAQQIAGAMLESVLAECPNAIPYIGPSPTLSPTPP